MFASFKATLGFLSLIPAGRHKILTPEDFGRFPAFFPAVGLVFGLCLYGLNFIGGRILPPGVMAVLLCALLVILNRGFHLDGLADAADALFSHKSRDQKLLIMKDSRQGTFGVLAIVLDILLKATLLQAVLPAAPPALLFWPVWGRLAASVVAVHSEYVGGEAGLGRWMAENSGPKELFQAALFSLVVSLGGGGAAVLAALSAIFLGFLLTWVWRKSLGGITGDLLGASVELGEIFSIFIFYILIV